MNAQTINQTDNAVISNVGILDLRQATPESIARVKQIRNVGVIFYAPGQASLIHDLNINDLGVMIELPVEGKLATGQIIFTRDSFKDQSNPLAMAISGQLIVEADVTEADVQQGLDWLVVSGQVIAPQHLAGVMQAKIRELTGKALYYDSQAELIIDSLTLDETYLYSLKDATTLAVMGNLDVTSILSNDLLKQKIEKIQIGGRMICREENAQTLMTLRDNRFGTSKVIVVPTGFELIRRDVVLDAATLEILPSPKLMCSGMVQIDQDVTLEALDQSLETLQVKGRLICPAGLRATMAKKTHLFETDVIFYEGELWMVEGEETLTEARLATLVDKATLVVLGELTIASDVTPQTLAQKIDKVHLLGEISATSEQAAVLQGRLGTNQGAFVNSGESESGNDDMANIGILKL